MKNFAIVSVLLVCFLVVSVTARSYAVVDLARVSAAMKAGAPYAVPIANYAPGKFLPDDFFSSLHFKWFLSSLFSCAIFSFSMKP